MKNSLAEKLFYVLIIAVIFAVGFMTSELVNATPETKPECSDLAKKLDYAYAAHDICVRELVDEQRKTHYLKDLDTNGLSCDMFVRHLHKKYNGDYHQMEVSNTMLQVMLDTLGKSYKACMNQLANQTINYVPKGAN